MWHRDLMRGSAQAYGFKLLDICQNIYCAGITSAIAIERLFHMFSEKIQMLYKTFNYSFIFFN